MGANALTGAQGTINQQGASGCRDRFDPLAQAMMSLKGAGAPAQALGQGKAALQGMGPDGGGGRRKRAVESQPVEAQPVEAQPVEAQP
ncbi:MAG: hypothetical protein LBJ59_02540, partial [Zoogloeaceae bacterium]|nr:hypothetical protein [Zoogloeaceae bacterium]